MNKLLPIAVACCLCVTCLTETQPPVMTNQFVGLWKPVRVETRRAKGTITADPDLGPNAIGYICYDPSGHMSVHIMNPDLPKWKDEGHPTGAEAISTIERGMTPMPGLMKSSKA